MTQSQRYNIAICEIKVVIDINIMITMWGCARERGVIIGDSNVLYYNAREDALRKAARKDSREGGGWVHSMETTSAATHTIPASSL